MTMRIQHVAPIIIAMLLAGCSSTGKKDTATNGPNADERNARVQARGNQTENSLENLRRGEPTTTPKDSPLKEIYFDFDSYALNTEARETLKADAEWLRQHSGVRVTVEGHCDERGTTEYNLALGAKRAQAAKDYLVTLGVAGDRVSTTSYGSEAAVCRDHNEACWQHNRRDRFVALTAQPGA